MQERQVEWLDREFPQGYLIIYTQEKAHQIRVSWNNPNKIEQIEEVARLVQKQHAEGCDDPNCKDHERKW